MKDELIALMKQVEDLMHRIDQHDLGPDDALVRRRVQVGEELHCLRLLSSHFDALRTKYTDLCAWFRMDTDKLRPSDEFFGVWDVFLSDVQRASDTIEKRRRSRRPRKSCPELGRVSLLQALAEECPVVLAPQDASDPGPRRS